MLTEAPNLTDIVVPKYKEQPHMSLITEYIESLKPLFTACSYKIILPNIAIA